ncbi:MAG: hypothetical protein IPJ07_17010 [Acidobacteria bacterium]|nr:hypothetical protein [Acidobacteriota bacterium]
MVQPRSTTSLKKPHDKSVLDLAGRAGYEEVPEASEYAIRLVLRDGRTLEAPFKYSRGENPSLKRLIAGWRSLHRSRVTA